MRFLSRDVTDQRLFPTSIRSVPQYSPLIVSTAIELTIWSTSLQTFNNTLYSAQANFSNGPCATFTSWQAAGQDRLSTLHPLPTIEEIVAMGRVVLSV